MHGAGPGGAEVLGDGGRSRTCWRPNFASICAPALSVVAAGEARGGLASAASTACQPQIQSSAGRRAPSTGPPPAGFWGPPFDGLPTLPGVVAFRWRGHYKTRSDLGPPGWGACFRRCDGAFPPASWEAEAVSEGPEESSERAGGMSRVAKGADCKSPAVMASQVRVLLPPTTRPGGGIEGESTMSMAPWNWFGGCSSMVELQPSKLRTRVRFPSTRSRLLEPFFRSSDGCRQTPAGPNGQGEVRAEQAALQHRHDRSR